MFEIGRLTRLNLGYTGEANSRPIEICVADWLADWPGAAIGLLLMRPGEDTFYPAKTSVENGVLQYTPTRADVELPGDGLAQIVLTDENDVELRSRVVRTCIEPSLPGSEAEAPEEPMRPFVDQVLEAAARAEAAADNAEAAAKRAEEAAGMIGPGGGGTGTVTSVNGVQPDDAGNVEIDIPEPPTKLEELEDDAEHRLVSDTEKAAWDAKSNFSGKYEDLTGKPTIPNVPSWALQSTKPTYTAAEVGALPSTYTPPNQTAAQVGADPAGTAASKVSTHNADGDAHPAIRQLVSDLSGRLSALADSDDTTLDQLSEIVAYIKSNKSLIDSITTGKVSTADIVNNLTSTATDKPLSAAQGKAMKGLIDAIVVPTKLSELAEDTTHRVVTDAEKTAWNAKSTFSGKYADLTEKPTIPTVPTKLSAFENDAGYAKQEALAELSEEISQLSQQIPTEQMVYAPSPQLPADGRKVGDNLGGGGTVAAFTNIVADDLSNAQLNKRYNSSDTLKDATGVVAFDMIPVANGDIIYTNIDASVFSGNYSRVIYYNSGKTRLSGDTNAASYVTLTTTDGITSFPVVQENVAYMRLNFHINASASVTASDIEGLIITVDEPIVYDELPGETVTVAADFDAADMDAQDIYDYMDALVAAHPRYLTKETLGKDASGTYDWCRYTASRRTYDAWAKPEYPAMYGWTNGSTTIYSVSVSPRVGDTLYTTKYVGSTKGTVTEVSNANQTRTVGGVVYTRDASKDVAPTLVYTWTAYSPYRLGIYSTYKNEVYNASRASISTIANIADGVLTDANGNTYNRYPMGDCNANFEKLPVIVLGANEHGGNIDGDPREPAIITARLAKDLCERTNADNPMLNMLKSEYMIVFCPIINPWGFSKASYTNSNGINIDRNFDTPGWSSSTDTNKGDYGGSEIETQYFMRTLVESGTKIAMANHALGTHLDEETGEAVSAGMCAYMLGRNNAKYTQHLEAIAETMCNNYDLSLRDMGEAPAESYGKTRSYIDHIGAEGGAVEMAAIDGYLLHGGALHTAKVLEADYTLLLQFLHMLIECQEG